MACGASTERYLICAGTPGRPLLLLCCSEAQLRSFRQALVLGPVDDLRKPSRAVDNHKVTFELELAESS